MQLCERGRLRLDDCLGTHIEELSDAPIGAVTIREVLGHTGGVIRDGKDKDFWQRMLPFPDRAGLLAMAREDAVAFARNEHFKYSNVSYALLGLVIEAAAGLPYPQYVGEHIIEPLGLSNTGPECDEDRAADFVSGHTGLLHGTDEREPIAHVDSESFGPATGFYSTAADMTTYAAAHFLGDHTVLSDDSKRIMQRLESTITGPGTPEAHYGVGMSLRRLGERELIGHSGGYPGHITRTFIDPVDQIVVSVLTNAIDGPADALAAGVFHLIDLALKPTAHAAASGTQDLSHFTGRFANLWGVSDIVDLGGQLYLLNPTQANPTEIYQQLQPVDDTALQIQKSSGFGPVGELVHYERDDDGAIISLRLAGGHLWPVQDFLARRSALARGMPEQ